MVIKTIKTFSKVEFYMTKRILVVEDDEDITHLLVLHLRDVGFEVEVAYDGPSGLEKALARAYDAIVLDLMLPGMDGLEICRAIRNQENYTPILMLTCKSSELDRVVGLELGADDYVTKPFSVRELQARIKSLLRRVEALRSAPNKRDETCVIVGDLCIDTLKREVRCRDTILSLTAKEYDLLVQFALHPGRVYTRPQLLELVWGSAYEGYEHTVNSHINRLRRKLECDSAHPRYILTVRGVGYKFSDGNTERPNDG